MQHALKPALPVGALSDATVREGQRSACELIDELTAPVTTAPVTAVGPDVVASRLAAALRGAADVVELLAPVVPDPEVWVSVSPLAKVPTANLHVFYADEHRQFAALLAYADRLGVALSGRRYSDGSTTTVEGTTTRDGVTVVLWAAFKDPGVLPATVRADLAPGQSSDGAR